jgi:hypothetical protein
MEAYALAAADFDRDGRQDFAIGTTPSAGADEQGKAAPDRDGLPSLSRARDRRYGASADTT